MINVQIYYYSSFHVINFMNNGQMERKLRKYERFWKDEFSMVTERNYAIWLLNKFRKLIPNSSKNNWKSTSRSMRFNLGNRQQVKTRWTVMKRLLLKLIILITIKRLTSALKQTVIARHSFRTVWTMLSFSNLT